VVSSGASAISTAAGVAALHSLKSKSQLPLTAIVIAFAFHQFTEDFIPKLTVGEKS